MFGIEYRPKDFESVLGLEDVKTVLRAALTKDEYDPAYLFSGAHSTGKTTLGRIFARSILCENRQPDMSPCNKCASCKSFVEERHVGYLEVDASIGGSKENVERILQDLKYETITRFKFILFDEAHTLTTEAKNALLKPLEQKNNFIFLFCTTQIEKMNPALKSRCIQFRLHEPTEKDIYKKLEGICKERNITYDSAALRGIMYATGRHYRDAENCLRQVSLIGDVTRENVKRAASVYIDEIAALLLCLSTDLTKAIQVADFLVSKMNISMIYTFILRVLNDTVKCINGIRSGDEHYDALTKRVANQYGTAVFEILDYILSKNRLNDLTLFQSDLLIIHYKFMQDAFKAKALLSPSEAEELAESKETDKNEIVPGVKNIADIHKLPRGQKEDAVRSFKMSRREQGADDKIRETVSEAWGPEVKESAPRLIHRREVTRKEFRKTLHGSLDEEN